MARAYSLDLRERVVAAVASGQSCRSVAKTLMVSVASVVKWSQRQRAIGSPAALKMGGHRPYLVAHERDWVLSRLVEKPDLTLRALLKELADRGLVVSYYALWHFLHHEGVTFKKKAFAPPNRTGRTSPGGVSAGRRVRRRLIRGVLSSSTRLGQNQHDAHSWPMRQRRTPRRQSALRPMADPYLFGGGALRRALCALRYRRTNQWRELPRLCRASSRAHPRAGRHCRHGQPRQPQEPGCSHSDPRRQSQALFPARLLARPQSNRASLRQNEDPAAQARRPNNRRDLANHRRPARLLHAD
jgi:transposase